MHMHIHGTRPAYMRIGVGGGSRPGHCVCNLSYRRLDPTPPPLPPLPPPHAAVVRICIGDICMEIGFEPTSHTCIRTLLIGFSVRWDTRHTRTHTHQQIRRLCVHNDHAHKHARPYITKYIYFCSTRTNRCGQFASHSSAQHCCCCCCTIAHTNTARHRTTLPTHRQTTRRTPPPKKSPTHRRTQFRPP